MRMPKYSTYIRPGDIKTRIQLDDSYRLIPDAGYRGVFASLDAEYQPLSEKEIPLEFIVATNVYQKIKSLPDEELKKYLEKSYESIVEKIERFSKDSKPYQLYLQDLINMDRNLDLYNRLFQIDRKINQKEHKAYEDLRWFAKNGIKLDEEVKKEIFNAYIYGDENLKKEMETIANGLGIPVKDIPYLSCIIGDILLAKPSATQEEIKKELKYKEPKKKKSKAKAIATAALILGAGAAGALSYHAYEKGKELKGDGSYFFYNLDDYIKYLTTKDKGDIDGDGIPNSIEEKYGLDMFNPKDAEEDTNQNGFTNLYDYQLGLNPIREYPKLFIDLLNKLPANEQKAYCNEFVKDTKLTREGLQQAKFLLSLSDEEFQQTLEGGLITNNNWDGDTFTNYFEKFIAKLDPKVRNDVYVILEDGCGIGETAGMQYMTDEFEKTFNIPQENVIKLWWKKATFENFKNACNEIANRSTENDIVFIGMVGHGGYGIFCFNDGTGGDPTTPVSYEEIRKVIDKINAKRMAIVVHACVGTSSFEYFKNIDTPECVVCGGLGSILDNLRGGGNVKRIWSECWFNPDTNNDGYVSLKEAQILHEHIAELVGSAYQLGIFDPDNLADHFFIGEVYVESEE